jgi:beta-galactosidase GanA
MHGAVLDTSGRFTYANGEIRKASREFAKLGDLLLSAPPITDTAIHFSSLNWNIRKSQAINDAVAGDTGIIDEFYDRLNAVGIHPDVIDAAEDMDRYRLIFSPTAYTLEESDFRSRITRWVENGGVWVVGPLSDIRTAIGTKYKTSPYGFLEELCNVHLDFILPDDRGQITLNNELGETVKAHRSYELFADGNFEPLLTVTGGHSALIGKHCALSCNVGKGKVILLGTFPEQQEMARLLRKAATLAGATIHNASEGIMITRRCDGTKEYLIAASVNGATGDYRFDGKRRDLITDQIYENSIQLAPYQVAVLETI